MKILAPITHSDDIDVLNPKLYNTEFFCGYLPLWWREEYSTPEDKNIATPINNRNAKDANVSSFDALKKIVEKTREYNTELFLVLNAKYYPDYIYQSIGKYIDEVVLAGITRMIVCDIGMINYLSVHYPQIKVSVSCLNQTTNEMAVRFYKSFGNVERIVFPRHMSSAEIRNISINNPELEFEYFIFSNKCLYDDGYCRGIHEFTPICKDLYYSDFYSKTGDAIPSKRMKELMLNEHEYADWTRSELMCEDKDYCTPSFACTACSVLKLISIPNINTVKLSIRGHGIQKRLRQVKMAHEVIKKIQNGASVTEIKSMVSKLYGKESLCDDGMSCMMI